MWDHLGQIPSTAASDDTYSHMILRYGDITSVLLPPFLPPTDVSSSHAVAFCGSVALSPLQILVDISPHQSSVHQSLALGSSGKRENV